MGHIVGLLDAADPAAHGIDVVHVWSYAKLLEQLPDKPWLVRHNPPDLEGGLVRQVWWQRWRLPEELRRAGCSIVLNTDAGTVCDFEPGVTMSRDMLSYEPGEMARYGLGRARVRLWLLRHMQNSSLRRADGALFLSEYASATIQSCCGPLRNVRIIPHGVREDFRGIGRRGKTRSSGPLRALYVSNTAPYKHQWWVVRAVAALRREGHDVSLCIVGGGSGPAQARLEAEITLQDPENLFITQEKFLPPSLLALRLREADVFVFASSCENMPNTLVEGMAAGLPIACSNRGPMPEVLQDAGRYFDPEDPDEIADALRPLVTDADLRATLAQRAFDRAQAFSWKRCADETFAFLDETLERSRQ